MNNPEQNEIESVQRNVEHALKMGEALERLRKNPDFKTVIEEGYLEGKVLASVSLLAVPAIKKRGERTDVMEDLISASNLQYFFQMVEQEYAGVTDPILTDEEEKELAQMQAEGGAH